MNAPSAAHAAVNSEKTERTVSVGNAILNKGVHLWPVHNLFLYNAKSCYSVSRYLLMLHCFKYLCLLGAGAGDGEAGFVT